MKTVSVVIRGTSPLLLHSFPKQEIKGQDKKTPEEQAEYGVYRDEQGKLGVPAENFLRCLVDGGVGVKRPGKGKETFRSLVASACTITPTMLDLGTQDYTIDSRPVRIKATKGTIMRHRARLEKWSIHCKIEFNENLMSLAELKEVIAYAGIYKGFGDFRPAKTGWFGRFELVSAA